MSSLVWSQLPSSFAFAPCVRKCVILYTPLRSHNRRPYATIYRPYHQHVSFHIACQRHVRSTFGIHLTSITELLWGAEDSTSMAAGCLLTRRIGRIRLVKFRPTILGSAHPRTDKMLLTEAGQSNGKFCPRSNWKHCLD